MQNSHGKFGVVEDVNNLIYFNLVSYQQYLFFMSLFHAF